MCACHCCMTELSNAADGADWSACKTGLVYMLQQHLPVLPVVHADV